jgi:hypothetical protein
LPAPTGRVKPATIKALKGRRILRQRLIIFCEINTKTGAISCRPFRAKFLLFVTHPVGVGYNPIALSGHREIFNFYGFKIDNYEMSSLLLNSYKKNNNTKIRTYKL